MTLEEIRREKKVAEEAIQAVLKTLNQRTGLAPKRVEFDRIDVTQLFSASRQLEIGYVTITMEAI